MITGQLSAELSATCSNLGHHDGLTYHIDPYCKESLKDLIRYLRKDDDDHSIRRYLGSSKILQTDLVPILIHHSQNQELFDVVLRLLMNLTTPALIVYQEQIPSDKTERNHYLQIISHLQEYKQAFVKPEIWEVLTKKISELLEMEYIERDEDVNRMMERILILARNVLAVPSDSEYEKRPDNDATIHDKVLWAIHESNLAEIFLYIASSDKEQHVYMHILEIVSLMLREQKPSVLATSAIQRSFVEKEKDEEELLAFRQAEIKSKQMKVKKYAGARHGNFGGTYVMKGIKAAGDKDLIFHKPLEKAMSLDFNFEKRRIKKPKHLRALKYFSEERRSTFGVRLYLKEFCIDFLNGAYNPLMKRVKEIIERGKSQGDESYYFWAMRFFMEFNRNHNFQVKLVSETVSVETFHFVQTQIQEWHDHMVTDKKKIPLWSRRMHIALNAYQELLLTLIEMDKSPDDNVKKSSQILKSRVFYITEYRDLLVILLHVFKENKFSRCYLKDLIETIHIFMKMLEKYCTKHIGLVVEKKKKFIRRKKKSGKGKSQQTVNLEAIWDQIGPQLSVVLQGNENIPTDIVPFDAASDMDMDQQKVVAMKKIQSHLKNGDIEEAIGLLRSSREVWPENDSFGSATVTPEEEFSAMQEIFMADLGQPEAATLPGEHHNQDGDEEEEEDEEEAYEASQNAQIREQDFTFKDFVIRFSTNKTLEACGMLLSEFEKNTPHTNHCIVKLLHRISWDQSLPAMVFQASIFRVFQRVLESRNPEHKELQKFAKFIVQKFIEVSKKNPKVFIELLFWKKAKDAVEIVDGYGSYAGNKPNSAKNVWTEEQEDELRRLHEEFVRDNPGLDMVDWIKENLINQERSRLSVIKKLKKLGLGSKDDFLSLTKRSSREWTPEEEQILRELVPQFLEAENPMQCIMLRFMGKRIRKHVVQKCLDLGLIFNKKQLYNKTSIRSKKPKETRNYNDKIDSESSACSDVDSGSDSESSVDDFPHNQNHGLEKNDDKVYSTDNIISLLNKYVEAGNYKEPLEWLKSSLLDTIEDIDEDETDVPLLPISGECVKAMEDTLYLDFLEAIGIKRPSNEQEIYWRIPGSWKEIDLRNKASMIGDAIDGKLVLPSEGNNRPEEIPKLKTMRKKKKSSKQQNSFKNVMLNIERDNSSNTDSSSSEDDHTSPRVSKSSHRKIDDSDIEDNLSHNYSPTTSLNNSKNVIHSDSDSYENREEDNCKNLKEMQKEQPKHKKRLIAVFDSDSDTDGDMNKVSKKSVLEEEEEKRIITSDGASEEVKENISNHTNNADYNEDDTDKLVQKVDNKSLTKRKRVITSDSSDNESDFTKDLEDNNSSDLPHKSFTEVKSTQNHKKRAFFDSGSDDDTVISETLKISHNSGSNLKNKSKNDSKLSTINSVEMSNLTQSDSSDLSVKLVNQSPDQVKKTVKRKKAVIESSSDED